MTGPPCVDSGVQLPSSDVVSERVHALPYASHGFLGLHITVGSQFFFVFFTSASSTTVMAEDALLIDWSQTSNAERRHHHDGCHMYDVIQSMQ